MNTDRKAAIAAGVIFIIATVSALASTAFLPKLAGGDYLAGMAASPNRPEIAVLLLLLAALTSASIAVAMYPVTVRANPALALASVVFRAIEGVFYIVAIVFLLAVVAIGQEFAASAPADQPALKTLADTLLGAHDHASLFGVYTFCLGAFSYYWLFWRANLLPRWLSGFGLVSILMMFVACNLSLYQSAPITTYTPWLLPILVQEMVMAVWLIVKGFDPAAIRALDAAAQ